MNEIHGDIVIAAVDGGLTCKRFDKQGRQLASGNPDFSPIPIQAGETTYEGVVIASVRHHLFV